MFPALETFFFSLNFRSRSLLCARISADFSSIAAFRLSILAKSSGVGLYGFLIKTLFCSVFRFFISIGFRVLSRSSALSLKNRVACGCGICRVTSSCFLDFRLGIFITISSVATAPAASPQDQGCACSSG